MTTLCSCSRWLIRSHTVVLPDAVPPEGQGEWHAVALASRWAAADEQAFNCGPEPSPATPMKNGSDLWGGSDRSSRRALSGIRQWPRRGSKAGSSVAPVGPAPTSAPTRWAVYEARLSADAAALQVSWRARHLGVGRGNQITALGGSSGKGGLAVVVCRAP